MNITTTLIEFLDKNTEWLAQFDSTGSLLKILDLCEVIGVYLLDKEQRVLYWNRGAEQLTGLKTTEVLGKLCPLEYVIADVPDAAVTEIQCPAMLNGRNSIQNSKLPLRKITQALYLSESKKALNERPHQFAGGIGLILTGSLPAPPITLVKTASDSRQIFQGIISRSPAMLDVFQIIKNASETAATVLVRGESGVGKELVAKAIHDLSIRQNAPFLAINCAALSSNLLESELFGHMRGAFTGAIKDHSGLFQRAEGGTLFLDEVAELPLDLQAKLLRVIQERNYIPVGGDHEKHTDVRIVAATHRSLREEVKQGRFREDLMYRLRVVPIFIPPLRERREDVSLLIWHFIQLHNSDNFRKIEKIEPQAMRALLDYQWPGNVRELHNVVEYAFAVGRGTTLRFSELPPEFREPQQPEQRVYQLASGSNGKQASAMTAEQEMAIIRQALNQHNGSINPAAQSIGMSRATFWRKRKIYGL